MVVDTIIYITKKNKIKILYFDTLIINKMLVRVKAIKPSMLEYVHY